MSSTVIVVGVLFGRFVICVCYKLGVLSHYAHKLCSCTPLVIATHSYIDTVGMPDAYRSKLERVFQGHNIEFIVEKKADAKYAPCSAASVGECRVNCIVFFVCSSQRSYNIAIFSIKHNNTQSNKHNNNAVAKESRDTLIANWKWTETSYEPKDGLNFGSGYPSDPKCTTWMENNLNVDAPFGYPDFVRFSWGPAKKALKGGEEGGGKKSGDPIVKWEADEDEEDESGGKQSSMEAFMVVKKVNGNGGSKRGGLGSGDRKKPRFRIFNELGLSKVTAFVETSY